MFPNGIMTSSVSVATPEELGAAFKAARIARSHDATTVAVIAEPGPKAGLAGYRFTSRQTLHFFSETLFVDSYRLAT